MAELRSLRRWVVMTACLCASLLAATPADAGPARLSADLADHLAAGSQTIDVIVHGDRASVNALVARYNLVVRRYLRSGAVLRVNAGQLAALQADGSQDHLSGDARIFGTDAVTAETIGADQVWSGAGNDRSLSGRGIAVAVIDSGVDPSASIDDAAALLGVSRRQIHYLLRPRRLETIRTIGGSQRVVRQSIADWLGRHASTESAEPASLAGPNGLVVTAAEGHAPVARLDPGGEPGRLVGVDLDHSTGRLT